MNKKSENKRTIKFLLNQIDADYALNSSNPIKVIQKMPFLEAKLGLINDYYQKFV